MRALRGGSWNNHPDNAHADIRNRTRELGWRANRRYVDDFCLFHDDKDQLYAWKRAIVERLTRLRLEIHEREGQVAPVRCGIPWLGFIIDPSHRRVKSRKVVEATRRLGQRLDAWQAGHISFGELDASVQGWIAHVR